MNEVLKTNLSGNYCKSEVDLVNIPLFKTSTIEDASSSNLKQS
jgi:hypothetical protein